MNIDQTTLDTYNNSAEALAAYFKGIGSRTEDIERALTLAGKADQSADVLELGCGDGRDAKAIISRVASYRGIDYSKALVGIARTVLPEAEFEVADMSCYEFPPEAYDVVYAFASLLHLDKDTVRDVCASVWGSLKQGGVFYISLKYRPEYTEEVKNDEYGSRMFYYYTPELVSELAGEGFKNIFEDYQELGSTKWFTLALSKK
jgi:SAM-dependent methyltransferase